VLRVGQFINILNKGGPYLMIKCWAFHFHTFIVWMCQFWHLVCLPTNVKFVFI